MCKQEAYSKYQKHVIKFLNEHLGTETPFTYERTQSNHLKVLIEGVEKPLFTSSTPSDSKTLKNFTADVKRELKVGRCESQPLTPKAVLAKSLTPSHEKLTQNCIKALRSRLTVIKPQEQEQVLKSQSLEVVPSYRHNIIKHAIARALQERKQGAYIKPQEMKKIEKKLGQHLDFMLPTLADYSALLANKTRYQKTALNGASTNTALADSTIEHDSEEYSSEEYSSEKNSTEINAHTPQHQPMPTTASNPRALEQKIASIKPSHVQVNGVETEQAADYCLSNLSSNSRSGDNSAVELMSMSANNRVSLLRDLNKAQALQLIDDINQALALNFEQDIAAVVALIKEKDIPLEAIISRVEMA